jgi:hypothetical protein
MSLVDINVKLLSKHNILFLLTHSPFINFWSSRSYFRHPRKYRLQALKRVPVKYLCDFPQIHFSDI